MNADPSHCRSRLGDPVLFLDVDGVISLFGLSSTSDHAQTPRHWIEGVAHCIPRASAARVVRLAERYEVVWATGWEELANEYLPAILGLPQSELPCLTFDGRAVFGSSDWKVDSVGAYAGDRPAAWVDDNLDDSCRLWALGRRSPTLLVDTRSDIGITDEHVELLLEWADKVAPRSHLDPESSHAV